jgi:hypothetical protein
MSSTAAPTTACTTLPKGARVVSGPAPQPLAAILLEYDAAQDALFALGTVGAEQFDAFFDKYRVRLALEYGEGRARENVSRQLHRARAHELLPYDDPVLTPKAARLAAVLVPRVCAAWPAIGAIALAVILGALRGRAPASGPGAR